MIQPIHKSAPKTSPPVVESVSCSSGGPSPVTTNTSVPLAQTPNSNSSNPSSIPPTPPNSNNSSNTNGVIAITPKIEHSPPPASGGGGGHHYEPHRQTVLMWGNTTTAHNNSTSTRSSPASGPTPTSNGGLYASGSEANSISSKMEQHETSGKWNGVASKGDSIPPSVHVYPPLHPSQHHDDAAAATTVMYSQALAHGGSHLLSGEHSLVHQTTASQSQNHLGNSCEVWPPSSYSQYQYFTYHHAPQHASTQ